MHLYEALSEVRQWQLVDSIAQVALLRVGGELEHLSLLLLIKLEVVAESDRHDTVTSGTLFNRVKFSKLWQTDMGYEGLNICLSYLEYNLWLEYIGSLLQYFPQNCCQLFVTLF